LGMSELAEVSRRASRRDEEECFELDEECLEDLEDEDLDDEVLDDEVLDEEDDLEDLSDGTSRIFRERPVVGSVVESWAGSWETWYPSMM